MRNRYFKLTDQERKVFQAKLILTCLTTFILIGAVLILISPKLLFVIVILIPITISIIAPFFDVPSLVEQSKLKYHSLFLWAEAEKNKTIKIHGGTLFDYYFVFHKEMTKQERTRLVLVEYLKGLQNLVNNTEQDVKIQGTSYIINERTAKKLGLKKAATNGLQTLILSFNYVNILISISLVKKSITLPHLNNIQTFEGTVLDINKNREVIENLIKKLEKPSTIE